MNITTTFAFFSYIGKTKNIQINLFENRDNQDNYDFYFNELNKLIGDRNKETNTKSTLSFNVLASCAPMSPTIADNEELSLRVKRRIQSILNYVVLDSDTKFLELLFINELDWRALFFKKNGRTTKDYYMPYNLLIVENTDCKKLLRSFKKIDMEVDSDHVLIYKDFNEFTFSLVNKELSRRLHR